jgi:hypothetical protein
LQTLIAAEQLTETTMKITKSQIRSALDTFLYTYADLTGGTSEECRRQSEHGLARLTALAATCTAMAANPNKAAAADAHLMGFATERVQAKLTHYAATYCTQDAPEPTNIIPFRAVA